LQEWRNGGRTFYIRKGTWYKFVVEWWQSRETTVGLEREIQRHHFL
jgi:hypothetical protein